MEHERNLIPLAKAISARVTIEQIFLVLILSGLSGTAAKSAELPVLATKAETAFILHPTYGVGSWIWADKTFDQQTCRLWRSFEIPRSPAVKHARLRLTADNSYRFFLDGREAGRGGEWRGIGEYDLTWVLTPGTHVLAVEAFNDWSAAGMLAGLKVEFADGGLLEIPSDENWLVVPGPEHGWEQRKRASRDWPHAKLIAAFGAAPWQSKPTVGMRVPPLRPVLLQFWQRGWFQITLVSICIVVALFCLRLMAKVALQAQAQEVLNRERARIARDIHDDLTARLTELVLLGEVGQSELPPQAQPRQQFNHISEKARGLLRAMNEIVWMVNSQRDTLRDFASYASKYAQTFLQPTPIRCRLDVQGDLPALPLDLAVRRNLFLAVKEALNNAVRYSEAGELFLRIHHADCRVVVLIEDNGKGFDPALADRERNGLSNMRQRTAEAGGTCRIMSELGKGCRVELTVRVQPGASMRRWNWKITRLRSEEPSLRRPSPDPAKPGMG